MASRFHVPVIPKGKHINGREQPQPFSRVAVGGRLENVVRSGLWAAFPPSAKAILGVFCEMSEPNTDELQISYRGLMRFSGVGSYASVARVIKHFERICLLKVERGTSNDGLRACNKYMLTLDHPVLLGLMRQIHEQQRKEIAICDTPRSQRWPNRVLPISRSCRWPVTSVRRCWNGIPTYGWKPNGKPLRHSPRAPEWWVMTRPMTQTSRPQALALSNVLRKMVGPNGLEPSTSSVSRKRSNQLSYGPVVSILTS